jgi:hypothetical protein
MEFLSRTGRKNKTKTVIQANYLISFPFILKIDFKNYSVYGIIFIS